MHIEKIVAFVLTIMCLWLGVFAGAPAVAQEFPKGPVRLIVPFPPGGPTDTIARLMSQKLQLQWSQPVVIEYKPGAGTVIGTDAVAKSAPDGRTIGGTLNLDLLPGEWIGRLVLAGLIEKTKHGEWDLSEQGHAVSLLLDEYSDRKYMWCSLAGSRP